jgi:hypothetical protein
MQRTERPENGGWTGRRWRRFAGVTGAAALVLILALAALSGRALEAPDWLLHRVEARVNAALSAQGHVQIGGLDLELAFGAAPRLGLRDVSIFAPGLEGRRWWGAARDAMVPPQPFLHLPRLHATLDAMALLARRIQPESLRLDGATITVRRLADGRFDLAIGGGFGATGTLADVLDAIEAGLAGPLTGNVARVEAENVAFVLEDGRVDRVWRGNGTLILTQTEDRAEATVTLDLPGAPGQRGAATIAFTAAKASSEASVETRFSGLQPSDLAAQSPALAWLAAVEAGVGGHLSAEIDAAGTLASVTGGLAMGEGALRPAAQGSPIDFDSVAMTFAFDPATERVAIRTLTIDSAELRLQASGDVIVGPASDQSPQNLQGQFRVSSLLLDPAGRFAAPVRFDGGLIDLRLVADPLRIDFGQITLRQGGQSIVAHGQVRADDEGWGAVFDARTAELGHQQLLDLWPVNLAPQSRGWLSQNLISGRLSNVVAALRVQPDEPLRVSLSYDFADTELRVMPALPPVSGARGHAGIHDRAFSLTLDAGRMETPSGGPVQLDGSVFRIADTSQRPAQAHLHLQADGTISAAMWLLDQPPFEYLSKAGLGVELAEGRALIDAVVSLPLIRPLRRDLIDVAARGVLRDVRSDQLVPGRVLAAEVLTVSLKDHLLEIGGAGRLDDLPFDATWSRGTRPEDAGRSQVAGAIQLSAESLRSLGVALRPGMISGQTTGQVDLELQRDRPAQFSMRSDLVGLALRLDALGWSKPVATGGTLELSGTLGEVPALDRFSLQAPGLSVEGAVRMARGGGLDRATLSQVRLGGWLNAGVELIGEGRDKPPTVAVLGGTADLRRANLGGGQRGAAAGSGGPAQALNIALDRVVISEGIALTGFRGRFTVDGGMAGSFDGRVNGEAPVSGVIAPGAGGRSALRLRSNDAGAVFRAAGVFGKAHDGVLDMVLSPRGGAGEYDGRLQVRDTRVRQAPVLADLLGAISVIGLLEQLNGQGLVFSDVEAEFRLTPQAIEVISASATGNSLGISLAGVYGLASKRMEMQGVISPIYMLNAIGGVFAPRRGEGLFGVNYRLSGSADRPQVNVNPLSMLAPGGLREVFRRAPPRLSQ